MVTGRTGNSWRSPGRTVLIAIVLCASGLAWADSPSDQAKELIPWKALDEKTRTRIADVVEHATVYHRSASEVFACKPELYLLLLHEPVMTLELWKALGGSNATLECVGPGQYEGADGHVSSGQWEFVYRTPELTVIYADGQYRGPLLGTTLETRSVLILRSAYFQERDGKTYVKHQLDGFVKAESGNLKPLARALKPVFQKNVQSTMQESLWFVSLMCRYIYYDPHGIAYILEQSDKFTDPTKGRLLNLLAPLLASQPEQRDVARKDDTIAR
jgi:hypothetical protein